MTVNSSSTSSNSGSLNRARNRRSNSSRSSSTLGISLTTRGFSVTADLRFRAVQGACRRKRSVLAAVLLALRVFGLVATVAQAGFLGAHDAVGAYVVPGANALVARAQALARVVAVARVVERTLAHHVRARVGAVARPERANVVALRRFAVGFRRKIIGIQCAAHRYSFHECPQDLGPRPLPRCSIPHGLERSLHFIAARSPKGGAHSRCRYR